MTEEYRLRLREMPEAERPRERLRSLGAAALTNAELIAILLGTGSHEENVLALATRLHTQRGGLSGLSKLNVAELSRERGLGLAKASRLRAALELGLRLAATHPEERVIVKSPREIAGLLMSEMSQLSQESLRVVLLNTKNQVVRISEVYHGTVSSAFVRPSEVYREAVRDNCPQIIVVHNHPSGDPTPSRDDINITAHLFQAGADLEIELLDHIVIGQGSYISMKEKKLGFL
jgi:DNA repair protein RadC